MQRKLSLLLVLALALSLIFCFGATAWAADDTGAETNPVEETETTDEEGAEEEGAAEEEAAEEEAAEEEAAEEEAAEEEAAEEAFVIPAAEKVVVSSQALTVNGEAVEAQAYNIDGSNYFKLRDLAALLANTGAQFNVTYEAPNMIVTTGEAYTPIDGDLVKGEDKSATCVPSQQVLLVDGEKVDILVYNIGGNNFFQLRGLDALLGFEISYDDATRTINVVAADAAADEPAADEEAADEEAADEEAADEEAADEEGADEEGADEEGTDEEGTDEEK